MKLISEAKHKVTNLTTFKIILLNFYISDQLIWEKYLKKADEI